MEKASGEQVSLREYLEQVWAAVAREALSMIFAGAETTGFEADARLTAMWLWTLNTATNGGDRDGSEEEEGEDKDINKPAKLPGYVLEYDAARKIAQGLGAHLDKITTVVEIKGDKARLLPVAERAAYLFGKEAGGRAARRSGKPKQLDMFAAIAVAEEADRPQRRLGLQARRDGSRPPPSVDAAVRRGAWRGAQALPRRGRRRSRSAPLATGAGALHPVPHTHRGKALGRWRARQKERFRPITAKPGRIHTRRCFERKGEWH